MDKQYLTSRVLNANDAELVAIVLEGLMETLEEAKKAIEDGEHRTVDNKVYKAREILAELLGTVEGNSPVAENLRNLYVYVNKRMTEAYLVKEILGFQQCIDILSPLHEAWEVLGKQTESGQISEGPAIVAGLTYGKGTLKDHVLNDGDRWERG